MEETLYNVGAVFQHNGSNEEKKDGYITFCAQLVNTC